jgi:Fic family protein
VLFETPTPTRELTERLRELDELRAKLNHETRRPGPWMGVLRRLVRATTVSKSTAIEGFLVSDADAVSLVSGESHAGPEETDRLAVECYARAMDHVTAMAEDPAFRWLDRVILALHFDACSFQHDARPGRWRTGAVGIVDGRGRVVYQAPDADDVPGLMAEAVEWLEHGDRDAHVVVRAAMAHLNVVSVHPFRDGNGRVSRIVQSLVLVRDGLLSPEFASIEEYLGEHTSAYYEILQRTHGPTYDPTRSADAWVEFCVEAHLQQARRRLDQIREAGARWDRLEEVAERRDWPDRFVIALERSFFGGCDRSGYAREAEIALPTASIDLRRMVEAGFLVQRGQGRATRYEPSDALRAAVDDPVARARDALKDAGAFDSTALVREQRDTR